MDNRAIKKNILTKRIEKGYSQTEVASMMNISQASYQKIEKGITSLISDKLSSLAIALDVTEEELVLGYLPEDLEISRKLEEYRVEYSDKIHAITTNFENLIKEKDLRIRLLEEILRDKNEIITHLKDKLAKNR